MTKKTLVLHPFFVAVIPVAMLYSHNIDEVSIRETLVPLTVVMSVASIGLMAIFFILKDIKKAGLIVSLCLSLIFTYGHIYYAIELREFNGFLIGRHRYLFPLWMILIVGGTFFIARSRRYLADLTLIANLMAFFMLIIPLLTIGAYTVKSEITSSDNTPGVNGEEFEKDRLKGPDIVPDIYYIIMDAYGSEETLKEIYDFDNHEFITFLKNHGFFVTQNSHSNYAQTALSMASALNMKYLHDLPEKLGVESRRFSLPRQMVRNNLVKRMLVNAGYSYVNFAPLWGEMARNSFLDWHEPCGYPYEFLRVLIKTTLADPFVTLFSLFSENKRAQLSCVFRRLAEIPNITEPTFTYAHLVIPHAPYVFGRDGGLVINSKYEQEGNVWKEKDNYLNQLIYLNKQVTIFINAIMSKSVVPPIIIIQSDHGTAYFQPPDDPLDLAIKERMAIFNAYYLPYDGEMLLYDNITPVNTFRFIFSNYFNADYELLEDRSYYSSYSKPYKFSEVSVGINDRE